jgi:hypothetical protein
MPPRNTSGGDLLRKERLKDGDLPKHRGPTNRPAKGTYVNMGVRNYGRTKKGETEMNQLFVC